jgi:hypothetical protein
MSARIGIVVRPPQLAASLILAAQGEREGPPSDLTETAPVRGASWGRTDKMPGGGDRHGIDVGTQPADPHLNSALESVPVSASTARSSPIRISATSTIPFALGHWEFYQLTGQRLVTIDRLP